MKKLFVMLIVIGSIILTGCSKVPAGNVGIKVNLYGTDKGVSEQELPVGKYWIGFGEELYVYPTFTQNDTWAKTSNGDSSITFQTKEGLTVNSDIGISYHIDPKMVSKVFQKYRKGNDEISDIYLRNMVQDALVREASKTDVESVYGEGKTKLLSDVETTIKNEVAVDGIVVEHLYWVNSLRLPQQVIDAINAKISATQRALLRENEIQQTKAEAQKAIEEAKGIAESKLLTAKAEADSIKIRGEAEASAIEAKSKALTSNPQLVQYEIANKWDGKLPTTTFGSSSIPMLNLK